MGWSESKGVGQVGTTKEVEDAHKALDDAGIDTGPLAMRALKAGLIIKQHKREELQKSAKFYTVDV